MKRLLLLLALVVGLSFSALAADPYPGCSAIYQVPAGQPYDTRAVRPPLWTVNRWECFSQGLSPTAFQNSPANGTDTEFPLALPYSTPSGIIYYPILYINADLVEMYLDDEGLPAIYWSIEQGTGIVTISEPVSFGMTVKFEIVNSCLSEPC